MQPKEILAMLQWATGTRWRGPCLVWWRGFEKFVLSSNTYVLSIRKKWSWPWEMYHCITVGHGLIYDPAYRSPQSLDDYERSDWRVIHYYRPRDFERLRAIQEQNAIKFQCARLWNAALGK